MKRLIESFKRAGFRGLRFGLDALLNILLEASADFELVDGPEQAVSGTGLVNSDVTGQGGFEKDFGDRVAAFPLGDRLAPGFSVFGEYHLVPARIIAGRPAGLKVQSLDGRSRNWNEYRSASRRTNRTHTGWAVTPERSTALRVRQNGHRTVTF